MTGPAQSCHVLRCPRTQNIDVTERSDRRLDNKYVLQRVSLGNKDCTKELKLECAYFLGQTS